MTTCKTAMVTQACPVHDVSQAYSILWFKISVDRTPSKASVQTAASAENIIEKTNSLSASGLKRFMESRNEDS